MGLTALVVALFAAPVAVAHTGARYDAAAHRLTAAGAAAADLRTPSAKIARVKAERQARAQAEEKLTAALDALGAPAEAVKPALAEAEIAEEHFGSDGSVQLTLSVSTEGMTLSRHRKHKVQK